MTEKHALAVPAVVGVLGGGRMGAGIAHAFLLAGARVTVVERDGQAAEAARERIERDLAKSLERGSVDGNLDEWAENLTVSLDHADFADCELVVEASPSTDSEEVLVASHAVWSRLRSTSCRAVTFRSQTSGTASTTRSHPVKSA